MASREEQHKKGSYRGKPVGPKLRKGYERNKVTGTIQKVKKKK